MTIDRRTWLKRTGAAALGLTALRGASACGDDDLRGDADGGSADETDATAPADGAGVEVDVEEDAGDVGVDASDAADPADVGADADDTGVDAGAEDAADVPPDAGLVPALKPLRRDGSHPYDYIEHVVILEMENRSFDHYFGSLKLLEGRADVDGLTADMSNLTKDGTPVLVHPAGTHWVVDPDPPHGRGAALAQWASGALSGFVTQYEDRTGGGASLELKRQVMGYHVRDELPALYGLADGFTLCDRWHCGMLGPTWPNRFFSHAATSDGLTFNLVPLGSKTIYSHALAAGLTYGVYHRSPIHFALTLLDPAPGSYPSADIEEFFLDAQDGNLPNITVIEPDYSLDDDHPPQDIRLGQTLIRSVYEALRKSPKWDRTVFLVLYDEHGGFFDHVAPPEPAGETRDDFKRMGFRVPGLVAGGLVRRGFVLHDLVEHSSVPGFIARVFGLDHVNERARLSGDFAAAFDLEMIVDAKRPAPIVLPPLELFSERVERALLNARMNQVELEAYARQRFGIMPDRADERRARTERYLRRAEGMGAIRRR